MAGFYKRCPITPKQFYSKAYRKVRQEIIGKTRDKKFYSGLYASYWHARVAKEISPEIQAQWFFTAIPNPGAGIGHQLANWNAGYWYAKQLGLRFAHTPFATEAWESFLGFGEGEILAEDLVRQRGYKRVRLPLFTENRPDPLELIRKIIGSYSDPKILFVAEQDQPYRDQFGVIDDIKRKFNGAASRHQDRLIYSKEHLNIAVHIRRGDIGSGSEINPKWQHRWQGNEYFATALGQVLEEIRTDKPVSVYVFSQGDKEEFAEFKQFPGVNFCLEMGARDSFLHMVRADVLITSRSSFSYKPALLNDGVKICPAKFWHGYPNSLDWIITNDDGSFGANRLLL